MIFLSPCYIVFHCEIVIAVHLSATKLFNIFSTAVCMSADKLYDIYFICYIFIACLDMLDRPRWIKIQIFLGKIGLFRIRKKKFGNSDKKLDFYGSENETRKFRLQTGRAEISRKNGSLPAKTGGLAALPRRHNPGT